MNKLTVSYYAYRTPTIMKSKNSITIIGGAIMAKKVECGILGTILLTGMAIVGAVVKSNVESKARIEETKRSLRNLADGYRHCEIKINVDTGDSTEKFKEYLNRKRAEMHIVELLNEASAMDDGLSAEEKDEKVKEAARRMGYDVGD